MNSLSRFSTSFGKVTSLSRGYRLQTMVGKNDGTFRHPQPHCSCTTMQATSTNSYHVLQYKYVSDILERRGPYREEHIQGAKTMADQSKLVMAGALTEPVDGAVFIFRNSSKEEIESFVQADPYVKAGLVPEWSIRPYMVVAGDRD